MNLKDKIVIITGSSRGIGKATAVLLAKEGAKVIITYKNNKEEAEKVLKILGKNNGIVLQLDITKEKEVKKFVKQVINKYQKIDVLVNNAGEIIRPGDWKNNIGTWHKTLDVNLTGTWLMIREIAPIMQNQNRGNIINITSTSGILGVAPVLAYSCSKSALISLTKAFAKEFAPYIRVNAIAPNNVKTDMTKEAGKELIERVRKTTLLQRVAKPEEIAKAILFLASDDSSYITGHILVVDGGYSLK